MSSAKTDQVQISEAKTGHHIAIIDGIHLHSMYNPIKEARSFVEGNLQTIEEKSEILVLGLGLGYHVEEIILEAKKYRKKTDIRVLEPNSSIIEACKLLGADVFSSIKVYSYSVEELSQNREFLDFLALSPGVIGHQASIQANKNYFSSFLNYKGQWPGSFLEEIVLDQDLKEYQEIVRNSKGLQELYQNLVSENQGNDDWRLHRALINSYQEITNFAKEAINE